MTNQDPIPYGDPLSQPFWRAAERHVFMIQRCEDCGHSQFYPRPFCMQCESDHVEWVESQGQGIVYSSTTVHLTVSDEMEPPYQVALVELDEGVRFLANIVEGDCDIEDRVEVTWRQREGLPPLAVFRACSR